MQHGLTNYDNEHVNDYQIRNQLILKLKNRFITYGYKQVRTPAFEDYDMYAAITKTVNKDDMIKVIDRTGKVLVLRPDGTIPITRMVASNTESTLEERLFYVLNVFRHSEENGIDEEETQAGVELFGNRSPEADAEIIALAVNTLEDIGFNNFKIEIGHREIFKELAEQAMLSDGELEQMKELIQSKNMVEMDPFLAKLNISPKLEQALRSIPMLHGEPRLVLEQTKTIIQNDAMQEILQHLTDVMDLLEDYGVADAITLNLGLINNMNYYTDIIFQGFVENIGKPVLMGGRYDQLGKQFGKNLPAVGFAYEVDVLFAAIKQHGLIETKKQTPSIYMTYDQDMRKQALSTANSLRNKGFTVITTAPQYDSQITVSFTNSGNKLAAYDNEFDFSSTEELIDLLKQETEVQ